MEFINRIINTLVRPKEAIKNISSTPLIEEAVMIVGVYALFSALATYIQSTKIRIITEGVSPGSSELLSTIGIVMPIVFTFIIWFILAGIIHIISMAVGGSGKFYPHTMVLVGFAMLPLILSSIISAIIITTAETSTITISLQNTLATQQAMNEVQSRTPFLVSTIINTTAWVWFLAIIYLELQVHHKLSQRIALIMVAIPTVLALLNIVELVMK
ncbi:MAG: YIP1 family protein [Candidatus Methanoperedens sp.]